METNLHGPIASAALPWLADPDILRADWRLRVVLLIDQQPWGSFGFYWMLPEEFSAHLILRIVDILGCSTLDATSLARCCADVVSDEGTVRFTFDTGHHCFALL